MASGQTVALGLPPVSAKQTTVDRSSEGVTSETKNSTTHTVVFVTARLVEPATTKSPEPQPAAGKSALQAKLEAIVIPQIQFKDAQLIDAVEFLRVKSVDLDTTTTDPSQKGVNIIVQAGDKTPEATITLDLKNIPLGEALKYVAQLFNLHLAVERYGVTLLAPSAFEAQQKHAEPPGSGNPSMVITSDSIIYDKHSRVVTAAGRVKIETREGSILAEKAEIRPKVRPEPTGGAIIIPKVQFQGASLTEATEFLRVKSREFDPDKKGMNILIKPGGDPTATITMQLTNVPAYEALRYCAEIAGHELSADGDVFVVTPKAPSPKK